MTGRRQEFPVLDPLDRRLNAFRPDLADISLRGRVEASRYVAGRPGRIVSPAADLRSRPDAKCPIDHQLLCGDAVRIFDRQGEWLWLQAARDRYVGWMRASDVGEDSAEPTHWVNVPRSFVYPGPDLKLPPLRCLSMGSAIRPESEAVVRNSRYFILSDGAAVFAGHVCSISQFYNDYVAVARKFLHTPYLWGGASAFGLDCSGLVYLSMRMCGLDILRDSDMQAATVGVPIDPGPDLSALRHGDLIFWRGHVGIVDGDGHLLHANGYTMDVASEPLIPAIARIAQTFEQPIGFRRPERNTGY